MRAVAITDTDDLEVVEVPDPAPEAGELLLRVRSCGICGTDLKGVHRWGAGFVPGHEFAGEVVAVGAGVSGWAEGASATALPLFGCGRCAPCVTGEVAHCAEAVRVGTGGVSGGYAEYLRVSAREAFALPEAVAPTDGALVEPLAVALHGVRRAGLRPTDRAAILGGGAIGLAVALWLRHLGGREVVVAEPTPNRRLLAESMGITAVDPAALADRPPFDLVFECVGRSGMTAAAIDLLAVHGRLVSIGGCNEPDPFVPAVALLKELEIHFPVYYTRDDYAVAIEAMASGRIDSRPLVTARVDLDGLPAAFKELQGPSAQVKVLIEP